MTRLRFRAASARRPSGAGRQIHRPAEIQFHRRQQRQRPVAARRPDRVGQFGAASAKAGRSRPTASPAARRAIAALREFLVQEAESATPASTCTADEILVTSGSLQALDLVNGVLLQPRRHRHHRAGLLSGHDQPADAGSASTSSASRSTATACGWMRSPNALDDLKRRGVRPKYIYTIPTVQNPTGTHPAGRPPRRDAEARRAARRADLRGRLLLRPHLGHKRPPALYAMSKTANVIHIGSFSKSIAPALRVGYIVAPWAADVAHAADQVGRRLRRARADGARRILRAAFRRARCRC